MILDIDRSLRLLRLVYETNPQSFDLKFWATNASLISGATVRFTMVGEDGYVFGTTTGYQGPPIYVGDGDNFNKVRALETDTLYVAMPMTGRVSGKTSILVSRRLRKPDGSFAGVILGAINPDAIGGLYDSLQLGKRGGILLRNSENSVLVSRGLAAPPPGTRVISPDLEAALQHSPVGHVWGGGAIDGISRLVAYRKSSSLPLLFAGGIPEDDILADYRRYQSLYLSILIAFTIVLAGAAYLDIRRRLKLAQTQGELEEVAARFRFCDREHRAGPEHVRRRPQARRIQCEISADVQSQARSGPIGQHVPSFSSCATRPAACATGSILISRRSPAGSRAANRWRSPQVFRTAVSFVS